MCNINSGTLYTIIILEDSEVRVETREHYTTKENYEFIYQEAYIDGINKFPVLFKLRIKSENEYYKQGSYTCNNMFTVANKTLKVSNYLELKTPALN
ncbi:hypothetical protein MS2017_1348 [Bathymodiolus thermophilus thioautotrophic gill symbiont]|uniref:Single-stranded DNA-binding protein n=1 Tax=Bathymodiolus thermophilus thioautotrophic gill symbiont TaxID=2360 RepID=A0A3G3IMT2_9GAMM|nr:single-stranded DNA-binding protein [Bathymodiolus thermophilus thioautotrophic gill symbiont]AYQ57038.1 hypothetical protein MS2017_1348 [Bathymodiolus thermophilus thioautotrophic gill symbiont]